MYKSKNLLKYIGSKGKLLETVNQYIPKDTTLIVEPFCGSASVSLSQNTCEYYLTDASPELINFLQCVRDNPRGVIRHVRKTVNRYLEVPIEERRNHYKILRNTDREEDFSTWNTLERAARYYFIIYHCFNGMYRVNQKGFCNVDFGGDNRKVPDDWKDRITEASAHMKKYCRGILDQQFDDMGMLQSILDSQKSGDKPFVFIDAPYHDTFDMYTKEGTRFDFWTRLKNFVDNLNQAGIPFLCTNTHNDFILDLFKDYKIDKVPVKYTVSRDGKRPTAFEAFITNR